MQVRCAADLADVAPLGQLGRDGHRVRWLALAVQVKNDLVDNLVRRAVMILGLDDFEHVGDCVLGEHHAAQYALLGGDIVRRSPLEILPWRELRDAHQAPPPCRTMTPAPARSDRSADRSHQSRQHRSTEWF